MSAALPGRSVDDGVPVLVRARRSQRDGDADPGLVVDHALMCRAVALVMPPCAVIGGHSAAAWYDAPFAGPSDPVTVLRPEQLPWAGPRGVRVHRRTPADDEVVLLDDIPVTSALRTAWDIAALESRGTAVAALDAMVRAGHVTTDALVDMAARGTGRFGVARLRTAVPLVDPRAAVPQFEARVAGRFLARVDLAWPDAEVALEYEGAYHFDGVQIVRDDARIAVVARVAAALALRRP